MKINTFLRPAAKAISATAISIILSMSATDALAAKKFYKWVDDQGVVHYSATPPNGQKSSVITTYNRRGTPAPNQTTGKPGETNKETEAPQKQETKEQIKDPKLCASAKKNLEVIETNHRIRLRGEDGKMKMLSAEEKEAQKKNSEQIASDHCE